MAKQIKSSDIFEGDIFENVRQSAIKTIDVLDKMNAEMKQTAQVLKKELGSLKLDSLSSIKELIKLTEKANQLNKETIAINKARQQAVSTKTRAEIEALAIEKQKQQTAQETIKTEREQLKLTRDLERAEKQKAKEDEKAKKNAQDQNNAYKQLERNTRELKNQSKTLGAELLRLEQNGKKNTEEYRKLSKQYNEVTKSAQRGDAQLKKLDKTVGDNFRNVGNYQSAIGGLNKVLGAFGIGFGVSQIKSFIQESINLSRIQEKAVAQVNAGLESTGGVVGFTLDELKAKASAFQKETLFGDETILTDLTSVMLTFTNVTGEAFDRAQQSALDLSTRMGGDLKGAAVQLGKALNDPVKGVTALSRVGVSFTEEQKEQIATLTESGKLYEAQTIILDEMNKEFGGSAKAAAEADGGITQLSNAFGDAREELGKMVLEGLKPMIQGLKEFFSNLTTEDIRGFVGTLGSVAKIIGKVVIAYGIYRTALISVQAKQYLLNGGLKQTITGMMNVFTSTKKAGEGAEQMGKSIGNAGRTLGAIPWVAIIGAVIQLATAFYDVASGAKSAREASAEAEKTIADAEEKASTRSEERQKQLRKELAERIRLKNEAKDQKKAESEFLIEQEKLLSKTRKAIDSDIKAVRERKNEYLEQKKAIESALSTSVNKQIASTTMAGKKLEETLKKMGIETEKLKNFSGSFETNLVRAELIKLQGRIDATSEKIVIYKNELEQTDEALKDATSSLKVNSNEQEDNTDKINAKIPKMKEYKMQLAEVNEYLTKQNELLAKIDEIESRKTIDAKQEEIDIKLANDIAYAKQSGEVQVDALEQLIDEKFQLEKRAIEDQQKEKLALIEQQYTEQSAKEREELIKKRDELLSQEGITEDAIKKINEDYDKQLAQIEMNDLQRNADLQLEKVIIADETNQRLVELDKAKNDEINKANDELYDAQVEYYDNVANKSKETNEDIVNNDKETAQRRREYFQLATDYFIKQSEERIKQIDKEIASAEKQSDTLRELAIEGNINAKESLAEQQRIINEANARKEKEQRRQQRLQLLNTAFSTYQSKVEAGSKNPLAETIRDIGLLRTFIETIPAFESGTEDTGKNGLGVDGKGGFHAILHPNERVIPKSMNEKIGSLSNEQLTKLAMEYQNGSMIRSNDQIGSSLETAILINKLDELTETIKMKPETNIELGEITQSMMEVVKSTKKGNTTTYNRYKIRK